MRDFSDAITAGMLAESSGAILLECAEIDHADLDAPFLIVANNQDIMHDGDLYTACPFEIAYPYDNDGSGGVGRMVLPNPDQWLTSAIRSLEGPLSVTFRQVSATDLTASPPVFDTLERATLPMLLVEATIESDAVHLTLHQSDMLDRAFPAGTYNLADFGGLRA